MKNYFLILLTNLKLLKQNDMKASALQLARQIVSDNKSFIEGNIADYLILEMESNPETEFFQYLEDEEIEAMNGNPDKWRTLGEQIDEMIRENFDYDISKFEY